MGMEDGVCVEVGENRMGNESSLLTRSESGSLNEIPLLLII